MRTRTLFQQACPAILALAGAGLLAVSASAQTLSNLPFDEGTGTTTADQASGLTGQLGTVPNPDDRVQIIDPGATGTAGDRAVLFNRAEYLIVPDPEGVIRNVTGSGPFTIEAWFLADDFPPVTVLAGYGTPGNGWSIGLFSDALTFTQAGVADVSSDIIVPPTGTWTHVAIVYEPLPQGGARITYHNDGLSSELEVTGSINAPQSDFLRIGAWLNGGFGPTGAIDRFRIHQGALSAEQLDSDAANPRAPLASTVVSYRFDETAPPFRNNAREGLDAVRSFDFLTDAPQWISAAPSGRPNDFALTFAGNQFLTIEDPDGRYQAAQSDLTLQAWVRVDALPETAVILTYGPPGGYLLGIAPGRRIQFTASGVADVVSDAQLPSEGTWHHIAAVHRQGQSVEFYVNGSLRDTRPYTGGVNDAGTQRLMVGRYPGGILGLRGALDRIRIDRAALPLSELDWRPVPGQDPDAPELQIRRAAVISWPTTPPGYVLQVADSLQEPVQWRAVTIEPRVEDGAFHVTVLAEDAGRYYRLVRP